MALTPFSCADAQREAGFLLCGLPLAPLFWRVRSIVRSRREGSDGIIRGVHPAYLVGLAPFPALWESVGRLAIIRHFVLISFLSFGRDCKNRGCGAVTRHWRGYGGMGSESALEACWIACWGTWARGLVKRRCMKQEASLKRGCWAVRGARYGRSGRARWRRRLPR